MEILIVVAILAAVWGVCGYVNYRATCAYFYKQFPTLQDIPGRVDEVRRDSRHALFLGWGGLMSAAFLTHFFKHGFSMED